MTHPSARAGPPPEGGEALGPATPVQFLRGVGPDRAARLVKLGIREVQDLVRHLPRDHQDRTSFVPISQLRAEVSATVRGRVVAVRARGLGGPRARSVVTATVDDGSGALEAEFWNQPWRARQLEAGTDVILSGRVTWDHGPRMSGAEVEVPAEEEDAELLHAGRIVPIHPLTQGVTATRMRTLVWRALPLVADALEDPLPEALRAARDLPPLGAALRAVHFPASWEEHAAALRRLKYEELFLLQVALARRRLRQQTESKPHVVLVDARLDARIRARLPFRLTRAQERCVAEIVGDLAAPRPMNRLLQGDVGSGKTAVAAYGMLAVVAHRLQSALLAPTEILAEQHERTLSRMLAGSQVRLARIAGGARSKRRRATLAALAAGDVDIAVGTHALLQEDVHFARLAFVVVDEQHKFGVLQRAALRDKGLAADLLVMSATPIPRTLTMTLFGDLDVSVLDELPPGRTPVETVLCREADRALAYDWVRREVARGRRVYHVVPLVDENEELPLRAATQFADELRAVFAGIGVGLLHGRMKPAEKDAAMEAFRSGATPILVATSVVEVGVDVPEATVLVVEHAERFGLAQLHQLRGRVGRGGLAARMICFHDARTNEARARLDALAATTDGFRIAEEDLRIRGPGEFLGTRQSGVPELRVADLVADAPILVEARHDAFELVARDPGLAREGAPVGRALQRRLGALPG